ncbi:MAG: transcriptional regulator [Thermoproteota archaeon]
MSKDQALGALLMVGSIAVLLIYIWLLFLSPWYEIVLKLTALVAVGAVLLIITWIGYTLATTPPPKPIEEIEKEAGKEEQPPPPPPSSEEAKTS